VRVIARRGKVHEDGRDEIYTFVCRLVHLYVRSTYGEREREREGREGERKHLSRIDVYARRSATRRTEPAACRRCRAAPR
jgi:hypothetical protein